METAIMYPQICRKAMRTLKEKIGISMETAYAMILFTSAMMDLNPDDDKVVQIILKDCGVEIE